MKQKKIDPGKPIVLPFTPPALTGRDISARNATKHGCCSTETLILASESHDEFKSLKSAWFQTYQPKLEAEIHLIDQLVEADWFHQRSTRTVAEVEQKLFSTTPNPAEWTEAQQKTLTRFLRYQTTRNNTPHQTSKSRRSLPQKPCRRSNAHPNPKGQSRQASQRRCQSQNLPIQTRAHQLAGETRANAPTSHLARLHSQAALQPNAKVAFLKNKRSQARDNSAQTTNLCAPTRIPPGQTTQSHSKNHQCAAKVAHPSNQISFIPQKSPIPPRFVSQIPQSPAPALPKN